MGGFLSSKPKWIATMDSDSEAAVHGAEFWLS